MNGRRGRWILAGTALAVMVGGGALDATAKKKSKKVFKVTVDRKHLKFKPPTIGLGAGGGTIAFQVSGVKRARSLRGTSKFVLVTCVNDLSIQTFPFTSTDCLANYTEIRGPVSKTWMHLTTGATEVTIDSYEPGVSISGRFHSVVPASTNPDLPPITLDGEFHGPVDLGDPNR